MVNKARRKGTEGENGVESYLNLWYPDHDDTGEGLPWRRVQSKGSKDEGDVLGPFTSIEVKNYTNPPVSALLDNAEGKGLASGRRYWFLVYKAAGFGTSRAWNWHGLTTLGALLNNFGVRLDDPSLATPEQVIEAAPDLCESWAVHPAHFDAPAPGRSFPPLPWTPIVLFGSMMSSVQRQRDEWLEELGLSPHNVSQRAVPFIVSPRRDPSGIRPVHDWYAYCRFGGFARTLETLGVLPQDAADYAELAS